MYSNQPRKARGREADTDIQLTTPGNHAWVDQPMVRWVIAALAVVVLWFIGADGAERSAYDE